MQEKVKRRPLTREERARIVQIASAEVGTKEIPPKSNKQKYGEWYGLNGNAWCAMFVSWVFAKANAPLGRVDSDKGYHYCPSAFNFWREAKEVTSEPTEGDIVIYDWNTDKFSDHTGIFVKWVDKKTGVFESIEGNTSLTNDSYGGGVMRRKRNRASVLAFVNPKVLDNVEN